MRRRGAIMDIQSLLPYICLLYTSDKTLFIKDVLNEKVVLYTRPRRFGKTLNMSRRCPPRRAILFLFYERERECISF